MTADQRVKSWQQRIGAIDVDAIDDGNLRKVVVTAQRMLRSKWAGVIADTDYDDAEVFGARWGSGITFGPQGIVPSIALSVFKLKMRDITSSGYSVEVIGSGSVLRQPRRVDACEIASPGVDRDPRHRDCAQENSSGLNNNKYRRNRPDFASNQCCRGANKIVAIEAMPRHQCSIDTPGTPMAKHTDTPEIEKAKRKFLSSRTRDSIIEYRPFLTPEERGIARELSRLFILAGRAQYVMSKRNIDGSLINFIDAPRIDVDKLDVMPEERDAIKRLRTFKAWMDPGMWGVVCDMFDYLQTSGNHKPDLVQIGCRVLDAANNPENHDNEQIPKRIERYNDVGWSRAAGVGAVRCTIWAVRRMMTTYAFSIAQAKGQLTPQSKATRALLAPLKPRAPIERATGRPSSAVMAAA